MDILKGLSGCHGLETVTGYMDNQMSRSSYPFTIWQRISLRKEWSTSREGVKVIATRTILFVGANCIFQSSLIEGTEGNLLR